MPAEERKKIIVFIATNINKPIDVVKACDILIKRKYQDVRLDIKWYTDIAAINRATYYRWLKNIVDQRKNAAHPNFPQYTKEHEVLVLKAILQNPDLTPNELIHTNLYKFDDQGNDISYYLDSRSYVYRLMRREGLINQRRSGGKGARHNLNKKRLYANGPNQIWVWDITYLMKDIEGEYFYLYAVMDLYSRKMVHYKVFKEQRDTLAARLIEEALAKENLAINGHIDGIINNDIVIHDMLVLHSDNGGPMKGKNMLAKLQSLGITASYSRPMHSNDTGAMESSFATLKHSHSVPIPKCFSSVKSAQDWVDKFYCWYNTKHLHSGINFITPEQCHRGLAAAITAHKNAVIKRSELGNNTRLKVPGPVSLMSFSSRRNAVERNIKQDEHRQKKAA